MELLWFPVVVIVQAIFTLGWALILSALTVHFRDIRDILGHILTIWFFATPVIYPYTQMTKHWQQGLLNLNPMSHVIITYQEILYFPGPVGHWMWLLAVGVASVLAAWYYTGGKHPYGYAGLGEVFVFVFFGLVAVCGTAYVQVGKVSFATLLTGVWVGALACAILVANNLRDIRGDQQVGKRTVATRLGDTKTRAWYLILVGLSVLLIIVVAFLTTWWALLGLAGLVLIIPAVRVVMSGASGLALIRVLKATGLAELASSVGFAAGLILATLWFA